MLDGQGLQLMWPPVFVVPGHMRRPHSAAAVAQERGPLLLRQSGHVASGARIHIYTADMRRQVRLQFYPDGYEWAEEEPLLISEGHSSHAAGALGAQELPTKFSVARSGMKQDVFLTRQITNDWSPASKVHLTGFKGWLQGALRR